MRRRPDGPPPDVARRARRLARDLGCELAVDRDRNLVEIVLPEGTQVLGNPGLNRYVNESETMRDAWAMTLTDLETLVDGTEPLDEDYPGAPAP